MSPTTKTQPKASVVATARRDGLTVAIGAAGATLFWLMGVPMAALTGGAAAVTLAALAGAPVALSRLVRNLCFLTLGLNIGAGVTPEVIASAAQWVPSIVALCVIVVLMIPIGAWILQVIYGLNRASAVLAATPGHLSYVLAYAEDRGLSLNSVALIQSIRVMLLALIVPVPITLLAGADALPILPGAPMALSALAALAALGWAVSLVFERLRVPAAVLLAGMVVSSVAHATGWVLGGPPTGLVLVAFVGMGALIGTRFHGTTLADLGRFAGAGVALTIMASAMSLAGAVVVAWFMGVGIGPLFVAYAPGGVEAMVAVALQLGYAPAVVAAHHVTRLMILSVLVPLMMPPRTKRPG